MRSTRIQRWVKKWTDVIVAEGHKPNPHQTAPDQLESNVSELENELHELKKGKPNNDGQN